MTRSYGKWRRMVSWRRAGSALEINESTTSVIASLYRYVVPAGQNVKVAGYVRVPWRVAECLARLGRCSATAPPALHCPHTTLLSKLPAGERKTANKTPHRDSRDRRERPETRWSCGRSPQWTCHLGQRRDWRCRIRQAETSRPFAEHKPRLRRSGRISMCIWVPTSNPPPR